MQCLYHVLSLREPVFIRPAELGGIQQVFLIKRGSVVKTMDVCNSSKEHSGFWETYRGCAEKNKVRPDHSPFYVNWTKAFASFLPEKPLRDKSRKNVEAFLADLWGIWGLQHWNSSSVSAWSQPLTWDSPPSLPIIKECRSILPNCPRCHLFKGTHL